MNKLGMVRTILLDTLDSAVQQAYGGLPNSRTSGPMSLPPGERHGPEETAQADRGRDHA